VRSLDEAPHPDVEAVLIDVPGNRLVIRARRDRDGRAGQGALRRRVASLRSDLGVAARIVPAGPGRDLGCSNRDSCVPIRPGVKIRRGSRFSSAGCTMGFLVVEQGRTALLTGGHCGHSFAAHAPARERDWWHVGLGRIGDVLRADVYDVAGSADIDIMSVGVGASVRSRIARAVIGFDAGLYEPPGSPMVGELLCMSLGYSNLRPCGIVTASHIVWLSETCRCFVTGAALSTIGTFSRGTCSIVRVNDGTPTLCPGDSGSPVYRAFRTGLFLVPGRSVMTPIGIADHEYYPTAAERSRFGSYDVYFATLRDLRARWDFRMWSP
jgi:hypothetical protein